MKTFNEDWIRASGPRLAKCHVKDFKLASNGRGGHFRQIRDGSVPWPLVRRALDEIRYNGWRTIEDSQLTVAENSRRLDLIIAGR